MTKRKPLGDSFRDIPFVNQQTYAAIQAVQDMATHLPQYIRAKLAIKKKLMRGVFADAVVGVTREDLGKIVLPLNLEDLNDMIVICRAPAMKHLIAACERENVCVSVEDKALQPRTEINWQDFFTKAQEMNVRPTLVMVLYILEEYIKAQEERAQQGDLAFRALREFQQMNNREERALIEGAVVALHQQAGAGVDLSSVPVSPGDLAELGLILAVNDDTVSSPYVVLIDIDRPFSESEMGLRHVLSRSRQPPPTVS